MNPMDPNTLACQKCGTQATRPVTQVAILREQQWKPAIGGQRVYVPGSGVERVAWKCAKCGMDNQRDVLF